MDKWMIINKKLKTMITFDFKFKYWSQNSHEWNTNNNNGWLWYDEDDENKNKSVIDIIYLSFINKNERSPKKLRIHW